MNSWLSSILGAHGMTWHSHLVVICHASRLGWSEPKPTLKRLLMLTFWGSSPNCNIFPQFLFFGQSLLQSELSFLFNSWVLIEDSEWYYGQTSDEDSLEYSSCSWLSWLMPPRIQFSGRQISMDHRQSSFTLTTAQYKSLRRAMLMIGDIIPYSRNSPSFRRRWRNLGAGIGCAWRQNSTSLRTPLRQENCTPNPFAEHVT